MKFRELCAKEIVQLSNGACLGRADDLELDPATAQVKSLLLLGQPHLFGLLGRDETLVIPWTDIETLGVDAILVRTELPEPEAKSRVLAKNCGTGWTAEIFREIFPASGFDFTKNRIIIENRERQSLAAPA